MPMVEAKSVELVKPPDQPKEVAGSVVTSKDLENWFGTPSLSVNEHVIPTMSMGFDMEVDMNAPLTIAETARQLQLEGVPLPADLQERVAVGTVIENADSETRQKVQALDGEALRDVGLDSLAAQLEAHPEVKAEALGLMAELNQIIENGGDEQSVIEHLNAYMRTHNAEEFPLALSLYLALETSLLAGGMFGGVDKRRLCLHLAFILAVPLVPMVLPGCTPGEVSPTGTQGGTTATEISAPPSETDAGLPTLTAQVPPDETIVNPTVESPVESISFGIPNREELARYVDRGGPIDPQFDEYIKAVSEGFHVPVENIEFSDNGKLGEDYRWALKIVGPDGKVRWSFMKETGIQNSYPNNFMVVKNANGESSWAVAFKIGDQEVVVKDIPGSENAELGWTNNSSVPALYRNPVVIDGIKMFSEYWDPRLQQWVKAEGFSPKDSLTAGLEMREFNGKTFAVNSLGIREQSWNGTEWVSDPAQIGKISSGDLWDGVGVDELPMAELEARMNVEPIYGEDGQEIKSGKIANFKDVVLFSGVVVDSESVETSNGKFIRLVVAVVSPKGDIQLFHIRGGSPNASQVNLVGIFDSGSIDPRSLQQNGDEINSNQNMQDAVSKFSQKISSSAYWQYVFDRQTQQPYWRIIFGVQKTKSELSVDDDPATRQELAKKFDQGELINSNRIGILLTNRVAMPLDEFDLINK